MHLITGGAGFIGSHIAARLRRDGETVRVLDNLSTGKAANIEAIGPDVEVITGDIRDLATVQRAAAGVGVIFHLAAEPSVPRSIADPVTTYDINVMGTLNVLLAARDAGVRRVVFASSSAVYGNDPVMPKRETMLTACVSPYASSKHAGEDLLRVFTEAYGLETAALRFFNVFGPRQDPNSAYAAVIPRFVDAINRGEPPVMYGDGEQTRDFVYIDDVVEANLLAATAPAAVGHVYNVATGHGISVNLMFEEVARLMGSDLRPVHAEPRAGDVRHSLADISSAQRDLGFAPATHFVDGLAETIAWAQRDLASRRELAK